MNYVCDVSNGPDSVCDKDGDGVFNEQCDPPEHVVCSSNADCTAMHPDGYCNLFGIGQCMIGNQPLLKYARCNPDNINNGGCGGTGGKCVLMHDQTVYNTPRMNILPQPGDGSSTSLIARSHNLSDSHNDIVLMDLKQWW
jgi:hypothetical protein